MTNERQGPKKAYRNISYLTSPSARILRIMAEYMEPRDRFKRFGVEDTIVVFGSARSRSREVSAAALKDVLAREPQASDPGYAGWQEELSRAERALMLSDYYEAAREISKRLATWSMEREGPSYYITTGGGPGMMEAANRGATEAGGRSVGLGISLPNLREPPNPYIPEELALEFHYFFMRKFWFAYMAKAVVVMPGGFGTMDELFETLTLIQTQKIRKTLPIVLYGSAFWRDILNLDAFADWGVINRTDLDLFHVCDTVEDAVAWVTARLEEIEEAKAAEGSA